jgi:ribosomal protein L7/L12
MDHEPASSDTIPPLSTAAVAALHQGNKIAAIKIVREERNIGLKEAKDAVEEYLRSQPSLQASLAASQNEARRSTLLWLAIIVALAFFAYSYFFRTQP